jgi:hypothetical protein
MRHPEPQATTPTSLPIHRHLVLGAKGRRSVALRVFCPRKVATIAVDECERCPRLEAVDAGGERPNVACYPGSESGGRERVGRLVRATVLCALSDLPLDDLEADGRAADIIPVVDESQRYIGALLRERPSSVPPPPPSDAELLGGQATAGDAMAHVTSVNERDDVLMAAAAMTSSHARCVVVVNDDDVFVGLLDDLALLKSFTRCSSPRQHPPAPGAYTMTSAVPGDGSGGTIGNE